MKRRSGAGPSGAGPSGAGPSGAGPSGAGPSGAGPFDCCCSHLSVESAYFCLSGLTLDILSTLFDGFIVQHVRLMLSKFLYFVAFTV